MHIPIQYAITYPKRIKGIKTESFDFVKIKELDFEPVDFEKFPSLKLAIECGKKGGQYPIIMNAANEEAVFAFLDGKISLGNIYEITKTMLEKYSNFETPENIDEIFEIDEQIRKLTRSLIDESISCKRA